MTAKKLLTLSAACVMVAMIRPAQAVDIRVTIENVSPTDSVALSPFTLAAHDGSPDAFDAGLAASTGIEDVAELGDGADLMTEITAVQPSAVTGTLIATQGGFGPGIFRPGASGSLVLSLDPSMHRYLSYAAMVVPSNDAFLGNDLTTAVELFDAGGQFVASSFTLLGGNIWDAGTEVNQLFGSAYVVGETATDGTDENGVVHLADLATQFSAYVGSMTPAGETFAVEPGTATPIARFSFAVVPEPASIALASFGLAVLVIVRRRR